MKQEIKEGAAPNLGDGGPAFPTENERQTGPSAYHFQGMTLRDYFAAKAMQGLLSNPNVVGYNANHGWGPVNCTWEQIAQVAGANADAMLKARAEGKGA